jgi:PAS domain S-box-containing protein
MMTIPGYTLIAPVSEEGDLVLYRATRMLDGLPVLLKVSAVPGPSPLILSRLEHEYELAQDLDPDRIVRPLVMERHGSKAALALEQGPTKTLASLLGCPMEIESFLHIAIGINAALAELHGHALVHKDLKPEHVLLDEAGHVWLTGLGITSRLPREHQPPEPPEAIAGTLTYMAPEQTGRMNRSIDSRSDLYALGINFYQMLTGVLPFTAGDPMEWVHCHIARQPVPPSQHVPGLPDPLSEMVMKLLAKTAEERYQSTVGLDADLHRCLDQWESNGRIDTFPLGAHDTPEQLLVPEKLYGRKSEIEALLAAFERVVVSGTPELVLVSGYSGIGKTSVVRELHKALVPPRGLFAAGKFDQYKRDVPYATLVQALQSLVRHILGKSEAEVERWRSALQKAVSPNGQLMVGLIPEVELIIGKQPPVPDLPPQEARNRFRMVLLRFLGVFAGPEHPLALFLDDLQWLDAATLDLLTHLTTESDVRGLLLVGAYRDNEVTPAHPLMRTIETIRKGGAIVQDIVLAPLTVNDVCALSTDSLLCDQERALPLAQLLHEKTGGNPFFVIQFLTALAEENLLVFDRDAGRWTWDLARIRARNYTENVVDLMIVKLGRLPDTTREALKQFACLGIVAEITTLSTVCGQSEEALHATLWEAVRGGLVFRQDTTYTFLHDRVHEAAYALVPEASRKALHLKIGRLLLALYPQGVPAERVFDVIDQFNRSIDIVTDADERQTLRLLNTTAGRKARGAVAHASARRYLAQAMTLLPVDSWNECYAESLALFLELAECEYLVGNIENADTLLTVALEKARTTLDLAGVHRLRMRLDQISGHYTQAVAVALEALGLFGVTFPEANDDSRTATEAEHRLVSENLRGRRVADLCDIPLADDAETRALIGLLADTVPLIYLARPDIFSLFMAKAVNICLQRGHGDESSFLYSSYAMALAADISNILTAQQFSEMAIELSTKTSGAGPVRGKILFQNSVTIRIWRNHFATSLPVLEQAFHACLDFGDLVYGAYAIKHAPWLHLECGEQLERVVEVTQRYIDFAHENRNDVVYHLDRLQQQFALALQGKTRSLTDFNDAEFDEAGAVAVIEQAGLQLGIAFYSIMKQIAAFIDEQYDEALEWAGRAAPLLVYVPSCANEATHYFYHAMTLAAIHGQATTEQQRKFVQTIGEILEKLKCWSDNCPENFANRHYLVSAEIARIEGRDMEAMRLYEQAIRSARDNHFVQQEALAAGVAARFYQARGFERIAHAYLRDAHAGYARWGAEGKVRQLERLHPWLAHAPQPQTATLAQQLDAVSVARAQQAISGEIRLDRLARTLLRIVMENAGAQTGYLSVEGGGQLRAEMQPDDDGGEGVVFQTSPCAAKIPGAMINYIRRSRKTVILADASTEADQFPADDYLGRVKPKSVLGMPIQRREKLLAVLYLENNLVRGAFTPDRRTVLEVLSAQAAISLETAGVYEKLRKSEERLRLTLEATQIGIFDWDVEHDSWHVSPEYYTMLGYKPKEGPGDRKEWLERVHPDDRAHVEAKIGGVLARTDSLDPSRDYAYEARMRHADGTYRWQQIKGFGIERDPEGRVTRTLGIWMDITGRKRAEEEIRRLNQELEQRVVDRTAKLEVVNKELEAFAYSVSHDLRAPLRHIDGFLELLQKRTGTALDEQSRRYMDTISGAAIKMGRLIDDLLSFSRMGRHAMSLQAVDLEPLVREIIAECDPDAAGRTIDWRIGSLPTVSGDAAMLRVVMANLIANAVKFTRPRDKARIEIGSPPGRETETVIHVRDNGVGFDMAYADKLFGVFQRLHRAEEFEGTGIGLANVRRIVARHGGRTWAEGEPDRGAAFFFSLPHAKQRGKNKDAGSRPDSADGPHRLQWNRSGTRDA